MVVMGVDASSRTYALFVLDEDRTYARKVAVPDKIKDPQQIIRDLHAAGLSYVRSSAPHAVYVEEPVVAGARNLQSSLKIARAVGAFMGVCASAQVERVYLIPVSSWKAEVVGNGNATKDDIRAWLDQNEPAISKVCGDDQDLRDAACIALYGQRLQRRVDALRRELQQRALDARVASSG